MSSSGRRWWPWRSMHWLGGDPTPDLDRRRGDRPVVREHQLDGLLIGVGPPRQRRQSELADVDDRRVEVGVDGGHLTREATAVRRDDRDRRLPGHRVGDDHFSTLAARELPDSAAVGQPAAAGVDGDGRRAGSCATFAGLSCARGGAAGHQHRGAAPHGTTGRPAAVGAGALAAISRSRCTPRPRPVGLARPPVDHGVDPGAGHRVAPAEDVA